MESKFLYLPHQETVRNLGLIVPQAQTATWMSYDTTVQFLLQRTLNKLILEAFRRLKRRSQWSQSEDHIFFPRNMAKNASLQLVSQNLWWDRYAIWIFNEENLMEHFSGNRKVQSYDMDSWKIDERNSLMTYGSIMCVREAVKRDFSIAKFLVTVYCIFVLFKDTLEEKCFSFQLERVHISVMVRRKFEVGKKAGLTADGKESREGRQILFTPLGSLERRSWRKVWRWVVEAEKSTLQDQVETFSERSLLDPFGQGTGQGTAVLADKVSRHYRSLFSTAWLHRKGDLRERVRRLDANDSTPRQGPRITVKKFGISRSTKAHLRALGNKSRRDTKVVATANM